MTNTENRNMEQPFSGNEDEFQPDDVSSTVATSSPDLSPSTQAPEHEIFFRTPDGMKRLRTIVDSSCDINVISEHACQSLVSLDQLKQTDVTIHVVSGDLIVPKGRVKLVLQVGSRHIRPWFYVLDDLVFRGRFDSILSPKALIKSGISSELIGSLLFSTRPTYKESIDMSQPRIDARKSDDIHASAVPIPEENPPVARKVSQLPFPQSPALSREVATALPPASDSCLGEVSLSSSHPIGQQWRDMKKEITDLVVRHEKTRVEVGEIIETRHGYGFSSKKQSSVFESRSWFLKMDQANTESYPGLTEGPTMEPSSVQSQLLDPIATSPLIVDDSAASVDFADLEQHGPQRQKSFYVRSVISNDDDVASQASLERPAKDIWAEDYVANVLVENTEVQELCQQALQGMDTARFERNLSRLLKFYYLTLSDSARSIPEKEATALLRRRISRSRIAARIVESLTPHSEEDRLRIDSEVEAAESWILKWHRDVQPSRTQESGDASLEHPLKWDSVDSSSDTDREMNTSSMVIVDVGHLRAFLTSGDSFCQLLSRLQAFLLPATLTSLGRILLTIPSDRISFADTLDQSPADRFKSYLESVSGLSWNWWPLHLCRPALNAGCIRIRYKCHCNALLWQDVSSEQAQKLKSLIRLRGPATFGDHVCLTLSKTPMKPGLSDSPVRRHFGSPKQAVSAPGAGSQPVLTPQQPTLTYQPGTFITQSGRSKGHSTRGLAQPDPTAVPQHNSGVMIGICPKPDLFVLLGARKAKLSLELSHLDMNKLDHDEAFFSSLKAEYRALRGWLRCWFSIWQLSHCKFSKFKKLDRLGVFSRGYDLPTSTEYVYDPRKPKAEDPPISPHEFSAALCLFGSKLDNSLKRIPKKRSMWNFKAADPDDDFAWGLEACHKISRLRVLIYNAILLIGPYAFWAYWQGVHPKDMQNASIPTMTVITVLTLFWTLTGITQVLREPSRLRD